jgi:hypothetical protein
VNDDLSDVIRKNGYIAGLLTLGPRDRLEQLEVWLRIVADHEFSDDDLQNQQSKDLFRRAAEFVHFATESDFPEPDGLLPLDHDFTFDP